MHGPTLLLALIALAISTPAFSKPRDPGSISTRSLSRKGKPHGKSISKRSSGSGSKQCVLKPKGGGGPAGGTNTTGIHGPSGGMITVKDPACGANGAVLNTTKITGPNGSIDWMDCGISSSKPTAGGWNPPTVKLGDLVYMDLDVALKQPSTPFTACNAYLDIFNSVAANTTVNGTLLQPILLASFAMQESSCNPKEQGGGGEVGMFQLSEEKCPGGKASDACYDVETNAKIAAQYIASQIESNNGNVFAMVGAYNGWWVGMTYANATAAATSDCCRCQNNLDYLQQFFNGWMLNIDAYSAGLGKYFNLNDCGASDALGRRDLGIEEVPSMLTRVRRGTGWSF